MFHEQFKMTDSISNDTTMTEIPKDKTKKRVLYSPNIAQENPKRIRNENSEENETTFIYLKMQHFNPDLDATEEIQKKTRQQHKNPWIETFTTERISYQDIW